MVPDRARLKELETLQLSSLSESKRREYIASIPQLLSQLPDICRNAVGARKLDAANLLSFNAMISLLEQAPECCAKYISVADASKLADALKNLYAREAQSSRPIAADIRTLCGKFYNLYNALGGFYNSLDRVDVLDAIVRGVFLEPSCAAPHLQVVYESQPFSDAMHVFIGATSAHSRWCGSDTLQQAQAGLVVSRWGLPQLMQARLAQLRGQAGGVLAVCSPAERTLVAKRCLSWLLHALSFYATMIHWLAEVHDSKAPDVRKALLAAEAELVAAVRGVEWPRVKFLEVRYAALRCATAHALHCVVHPNMRTSSAASSVAVHAILWQVCAGRII